MELERRLQQDNTMSDERKQRQLLQLGKKESTFLRLRRTRLGLDDFRTVKVIGKGAFGEVRYNTHRSNQSLILPPGSSCSKNGHRKDLCNENVEEGRNVEEGSGM